MEPTHGTSTAPSPLTRALDTIRKLRAQLEAGSGHGPVAVVGVGLRFAGGIDDLDSYWDALAQGRDLVHPLPESRQGPFAADWAKLPHAGGFLDEILDFDADFFDLRADEARALDPQQRLLLEVAWEALENAALPPDRIDGPRTGLFIGITSQEYWNWQAGTPDINWISGNGHCFAVGRLAYVLGAAGPAIAVDTACSSSLVSVHLARQALGRRECDVALAGGVHLVLSPHGTRLLHLAGMLSPEGRCKAFDARADGLARGEGCGIVVLKRLEDALRDGDRIHAVLQGSAVNQSGRSTGFRAPNVLSEITLLETALADAGLSPADIGLVEAHGTGTSLGDTIEIEAIAAALGRKNGGIPLPVGSVKTNMGHLEPAAGVAALIKSILCLRHRAVPPLVHLSTLNPLIDLDGTGILLPTELTPWPAGGGGYAAVSAFGMGGTNAHVVVGPAPESAPPTAPAAAGGAGSVGGAVGGFELSAKTPEAMTALATRFLRCLARLPDESYPAFAYTVTFGRARHLWRARVVAADRAAALTALHSLANGEPASAVTLRQHDAWGDEESTPPDALPRAVADLPHYPWTRQRYAPPMAGQPAVPMAGQPAVAPTAAQPAVPMAGQPAVAPTARAAPPAPGPAAAPAADGSAGIRRKLLAVEPGRRRTALLIRHCRELAAQVVGGSIADIDPAAPLASLGFDSMRTLELRARLEQSLDVKLSAAVGWQFPTLEALAPFLAERMGIGLVAAGPGPAGGRSRPLGRDQRAEVGDLSDSQIEALLMARLEQLDAGN